MNAPRKNERIFRTHSFKLFLCGASVLFWELVFIRWLGACIPLVKPFSNFILISAFTGLGAGALFVRFRFRLQKLVFPTLALCVIAGPLIGAWSPETPGRTGKKASPERTWEIIADQPIERVLANKIDVSPPYPVVLFLVFAVNTAVFLVFGQWLGLLFRRLRPLFAYTLEIGGSIFGIFLFTLATALVLPPAVWFSIGFALVFAVTDRNRDAVVKAGASLAAILLFSVLFIAPSNWSAYHRIAVSPFHRVRRLPAGTLHAFDIPAGKIVSIDHKNRQFLFTPSPDDASREFFRDWKGLYARPYATDFPAPSGPVLIVNSGVGNEVAAALEGCSEPVDAVELDPALLILGERHHPESPYSSNRVSVFVEDARSFFKKTDKKYSRIILGHSITREILHDFESVRVENFMLTREAFREIRKLLVPGGRLFLSFDPLPPPLDRKIRAMLGAVFRGKIVRHPVPVEGSPLGVLYSASRLKKGETGRTDDAVSEIPRDDRPFFFMQSAGLPAHYRGFMAMIVLLGLSSLLLLPRGRRKIRFPYFFMGAAFFLIETSNVVSLSRLYGSTGLVNITVFTWILGLILLGNFTAFLMKHPRNPLLFSLLFLSILVSFAISPSGLLGMESRILQGFLAGIIFLGPIYFSSVIFANLIKREHHLYQAYGSNLLGAMIGAACEYFSILLGIRFLLVFTFLFYVLTWLVLRKSRFANA